MLYHASPKLIAPRHNGLTLTEAVGERSRCLPRRDLGSGAMGKDMVRFQWGFLAIEVVELTNGYSNDGTLFMVQGRIDVDIEVERTENAGFRVGLNPRLRICRRCMIVDFSCTSMTSLTRLCSFTSHVLHDVKR